MLPILAGQVGLAGIARAASYGRWVAALVTCLLACGPLRARLLVTASDLFAVRGDRIIVGWLPEASALAQDAPPEVSLGRTPAAETALRRAAPADLDEIAECMRELADAPAHPVCPLRGAGLHQSLARAVHPGRPVPVPEGSPKVACVATVRAGTASSKLR